MSDVKLYVDELIEKYTSMSAPEYVRLEDLVTDESTQYNVSQEDYDACMDLVLGQTLYGYANGKYDLDYLKEVVVSKGEIFEDSDIEDLPPIVVDCYKQLNKVVYLIEELEK